MYLLIATVSYLAAGILLYNGIENSSFLIMMLAAVCMAVGNYNIKQYKLKK